MFSSLASSSALIPTINYTLPSGQTLDLTQFVLAIGVFIGLMIVFKLVQVVVLARLKQFSKKSKTDVDDVIIGIVSGIKAWVYTVVALYVALSMFTLPSLLGRVTMGVFLIAITWQLIAVATELINFVARRVLARDEDGDGVTDPNADMAAHMVTLFSRVVLWALGALFILSNVGIQVTSLIAGLGIGGIAVAFALQGILSDLFASFSIYFDKPFRLGDFVTVGGDSGTVERIGIKTTRLRTLQGEELVISNAELTTSRVQNFKKMQERRVLMQFGVTYETTAEKLPLVPGMVKEIFDGIESARFDRTHFTTFGDSALIFEVVYYITTSDYVQYLDAQQQFNLALMTRFAEQGIEFAYPTQTIYTKTVS